MKATFSNSVTIKLSEDYDTKDFLFYSKAILALCEKHLQNRNISPKMKLFSLKNKSFAINNMGFVFDTHGDIAKALEYYHQSLKIDVQIKDTLGMATGICNMAFVLTGQGEIKKTLEYYDKCLMLFKSINDKIGIATVYNGLPMLAEYNEL